MNKRDKTGGFSLIETAIAMVIISLLMAGLVRVYEQYVINKRKAEFTQTMNSVTSALAYYIQDQGLFSPAVANIPGTAGVDESYDPTRYPCPAAPLFGPGDANYGVEQRNTTTGRCITGNGVVATGPPGDRIFIGSIPAVTLAISNAHMLDPYGRRLTYAVSSTVSNSMPSPTARGGVLGGGQNPAGSIRINQYDDTGAISATKTNVPFIIVAHGENGAGAYTNEGTLARPCTPAMGGRDLQNCDNDANNVFADATNYVSTNTASAAEYDDTVVFSLKGIADKEDYWGLGVDTTDIISLNSGNVGIGLNAPAQKLDVQGRVRAHSYLHSSDIRLKKNIEPMGEDALKKIMMMKIVTYDYIKTPEDYKKMGLIAQDLKKLYPGLVFEGSDGYLSVDYVSLTAPIIKALQQLSADKDKEISDLKGQISDITKRLELLEKNTSDDGVLKNGGKNCYND